MVWTPWKQICLWAGPLTKHNTCIVINNKHLKEIKNKLICIITHNTHTHTHSCDKTRGEEEKREKTRGRKKNDEEKRYIVRELLNNRWHVFKYRLFEKKFKPCDGWTRFYIIIKRIPFLHTNKADWVGNQNGTRERLAEIIYLTSWIWVQRRDLLSTYSP